MEVKKYTLMLFTVTLAAIISHVQGSGSLYDPPNRAVMWKYGFYTDKNYNYMQLNCGGEKQPENGPFKCGICGDPHDLKREHEKGGKYGTRTITRYYPAGVKEISVKIELLAFEKGFFEFRVCAANNNTVTQECLDENILPIKEGYLAGTPLRFYPKGAGDFRLTVAVPPNLTCERCVLQWRYHTANSWGTDPVSLKQGLGLGPQEEFRNCADIRIGGTVPKSVRENPFFAPPDARRASTIDRPTEQRKKLASSNDTRVITPDGADRFSPAIRTLLNGINGLRQMDKTRIDDITSGSSHNTSGLVDRKLETGSQNMIAMPDINTNEGGVSNIRVTADRRQDSGRMNLMPIVRGAASDLLQGPLDANNAQGHPVSSDLNINNLNGGFSLDNVLHSKQNGQRNLSLGTIKVSDTLTGTGSKMSTGSTIGQRVVGPDFAGVEGQGRMLGEIRFTGSFENQNNNGSGLVGGFSSHVVGGSAAGTTLAGGTDSQNIVGTSGDVGSQKSGFTGITDTQMTGGTTFKGGSNTQVAGGTASAGGLDIQMTRDKGFTGGSDAQRSSGMAFTRGSDSQTAGGTAFTEGFDTQMTEGTAFNGGFDTKMTRDKAFTGGFDTHMTGGTAFTGGIEMNGENTLSAGSNTQINNGTAFTGGFDTQTTGGSSFTGGIDTQMTGDKIFTGVSDTHMADGTAFTGGIDTQMTGGMAFAKGPDTQMTGGMDFTGGIDTQMTGGMAFAGGPSTRIAGGMDLTGGPVTQMTGGMDFAGGSDTQMAGGMDFKGGPDTQMTGGMGFTGGSGNQMAGGMDFKGGPDSQMTGGTDFTGGPDTRMTGGTAFTEDFNTRTTGGTAFTGGFDTQMNNRTAFIGGSENRMADRSSLSGSIINLVTDKRSGQFPAGLDSKMKDKATGSTSGKIVDGIMSVETTRTVGGIDGQIKDVSGSQASTEGVKKQFSSGINLQNNQENIAQHGSRLTTGITDMATAILGMDIGGTNLQTGSVSTAGNNARGGLKVDQALMTPPDINIPSVRNAKMVDATGVVGPAPKPSKKASISLEGVSITNAESGVGKSGEMKAATRSGFAVTGEKAVFGTNPGDVMPSKFDQSLNAFIQGGPFVDLSQQTIEQGTVTNMNTDLNINAGLGSPKAFASERTSMNAGGKIDTSTSNSDNSLTFSDMIIPDLTLDGSITNTITDKVNTNLDVGPSPQNMNTNKAIKQQIVSDITRNINMNMQAGFVGGEAPVGKTGLSTDKTIADKQQVVSMGTDVITETGTSGQNVQFEPSLSVPGLQPSSGRQRIFLVRASRPQTVLLSSSAEGSNRGMTISESLQPSADVVRTPTNQQVAPSSDTKSQTSKSSNINAENAISNNAAAVKSTGKSRIDVSASGDTSILPEPLINSLNPLDKSGFVVDSSIPGLTASEVIDPLRTQTLRSDGAIAGEHEFLPSGDTNIITEKTGQTVAGTETAGAGSNTLNEIDAFRNELVKSSLRQGGALIADKPAAKTASSKSQTEGSSAKAKKETGAKTILGGTSLLLSNEVGGKSAASDFGQTVTDLLNEAQKILSTTADITNTQTANIEGAANIEGTAGTFGKNSADNLTAKKQDKATASSSVTSESVLGTQGPMTLADRNSAGVDHMSVTASDGTILGSVDLHVPTTDVLNIPDLIGSPTSVNELHGVSSEALASAVTTNNMAPEAQGTSGIIAVLLDDGSHSSGANFDFGGSQTGTDQLVHPSFDTVSMGQNINTVGPDHFRIPDVINQRTQIGTVGSSGTVGTSGFVGSGTNQLRGRTELAAGIQDINQFATITNPLESITSSNVIADTHGDAAIIDTLGSNVVFDTLGRNIVDGTVPAVGGIVTDTLRGSAMIGTDGGGTVAGARGGSAVIGTDGGRVISGAVGGSATVGSLPDIGMTDSSVGSFIPGIFRPDRPITGTDSGGIIRDTLINSAKIGTIQGTTVVGPPRGSVVSPRGSAVSPRGSAVSPRGSAVSETFGGSTMMGSSHGIIASGPTMGGGLVMTGARPGGAMINTFGTSAADTGSSLDTSLGTRLGGNILDFSSSAQRTMPSTSDITMRQEQVVGVQETNKQSIDSSPTPTHPVIPDHILDLRNVISRQTGGSGWGMSMGSDSAGKSGTIERTDTVSTSSERIDHTLSVQRGRNISGSRSGRRVIGGNNIITNARQATAAPPRRITNRRERVQATSAPRRRVTNRPDIVQPTLAPRRRVSNRPERVQATEEQPRREISRLDRVNIEQQINSFSFQDIPSSPVIDAGVQMGGDGSMTAGFGPRGREMMGGRMEERRFIDERSRGGVRGSSGRRNVGRSDDMFRVLTDPRTGFEERIPTRGMLGDRVPGDMRVSRIERVIVQGRDGRSGAGSGRMGPEYFLDMSGSAPESRVIGRTVVRERPAGDRGADSSVGRVIEIRDIRVGPSRGGGGGGARSGSVRLDGGFRGDRRGDRRDGRGRTSRGDRSRGDRRRTLTPAVGGGMLPAGGSMSAGRGFGTGMAPFGRSFPMMGPGPMMSGPGPMGGMPFDGGMGPRFPPGAGPGFGPGMGMGGGMPPPFPSMGFGPGMF